MPNVKQLISAHNASILKKDMPQETPKCNCSSSRGNIVCPVEGKCQSKSVIYQAKVTRQDDQEQETYIGLTDNTFKTRFNSHKCSFNNENHRNETTLSHYIWTLKDSGTPYSVSWKIIGKSSAFTPSSNKCNLCLLEKYYIICKPEMATLNRRNELTSTCRHKKKYLLCNIR